MRYARVFCCARVCFYMRLLRGVCVGVRVYDAVLGSCAAVRMHVHAGERRGWHPLCTRTPTLEVRSWRDFRSLAVMASDR